MVDVPVLSPFSVGFPPPETALQEPNGLLAIGGDLTSERLLNAYRTGIFPWFNENQPILWWSPHPRTVLFPDHFLCSRSLRKRLHNSRFSVCCDQQFEAVVRACAEPRSYADSTWISEEMLAAYCALHEKGWAHSVETYLDGVLVGGLYGVSIGRLFFGESMFTKATDASKVALATTVAQLKHCGFPIIDCQMPNPHLTSLGAMEISRTTFLAYLHEHIDHSPNENPWRKPWIQPQHLYRHTTNPASHAPSHTPPHAPSTRTQPINTETATNTTTMNAASINNDHR